MTISRSLVPPQFAIPPAEYSQHYFADVTRAFSVFVVQLQQPGEGRATTMTFTDLPTDDTGLEEGALFMVDGLRGWLIPTPQELAVQVRWEP